MHTSERGFIMSVVLISILALSLAGATAVLIASSEVDMAGQLRQRRQLESCAASGVDIGAANLPTPGNAPTTWAIDQKRATGTQQYVATAEHVDTTPLTGIPGYTATRGALSADAARNVINAGLVGASFANGRSTLGQATPPALPRPTLAAQTEIQVFRLVSTCQQKSTSARLEAEGVYVYNPQ